MNLRIKRKRLHGLGILTNLVQAVTFGMFGYGFRDGDSYAFVYLIIALFSNYLLFELHEKLVRMNI